MHWGRLGAILGGTGLFFTIILIFAYPQLDFDQQLIISAENDASSSFLISQIENESIKERITAKNKFMLFLLNTKYWFQIGKFDESDIVFQRKLYEQEISLIDEQEQLRKDFVAKKITRDEFLINSMQYKKGFFFDRLG